LVLDLEKKIGEGADPLDVELERTVAPMVFSTSSHEGGSSLIHRKELMRATTKERLAGAAGTSRRRILALGGLVFQDQIFSEINFSAVSLMRLSVMSENQTGLNASLDLHFAQNNFAFPKIGTCEAVEGYLFMRVDGLSIANSQEKENRVLHSL